MKLLRYPIQGALRPGVLQARREGRVVPPSLHYPTTLAIITGDEVVLGQIDGNGAIENRAAKP
jgi:hypothetical protein